MHNSQLNELSIPQKERISPSGRENTLSSIIEKIAKQSTHLSSVGYKGLCVGKFTDKTNWKPEGENVIRAGKYKSVIIMAERIFIFALMTELWGHYRFAR